ncbi:hypothetical protein N7451_012003 [Penicillium sp. IBT 35674x]|nr:hypothetical protein N7451_012003 [Penicillium sp. IBT 35674x]
MPQSPRLYGMLSRFVVPDKEDRTCCGLTKRGTPCKLFVTENIHQMGVKKLNELSRDPFDLRTLRDKLQDIVPDFLCARWHRQLQAHDVRERWEAAAIRNQALVNTPQVAARGNARYGQKVAFLWSVQDRARQCHPAGLTLLDQ